MRLRAVLGAVAILFLPAGLFAQRAVFVVRHAEKASETNEPSVPLSAAGSERARKLSLLLRDVGITAIYSTDTIRTRATVEPLAKRLALDIRIYAASGPDGKIDLAPLAARLASENSADIVLVVGHSNTIAPLLASLGAKESIEIADGDYDKLFLLIPRRPGAPLLLRMHF